MTDLPNHTRVTDANDGSVQLPNDLVWEALRRGILEQIKVIKLRTSWDELQALRKEMATIPPDQAALEGGDVPDDEAVT